MKNLKKLGKTLDKKEQQSINGGMLAVYENRCTPSQAQYTSCSGAIDGRICYTNNCQCPGQCFSEICGPLD